MSSIKNPEVSIVIVNWNTKDLLNQTLQSIYSNKSSINFETIVVDNASSDDSVKMVKKTWKQVKLIDLPRNIGFGAANNKAFEQTRGRFVLVLNSDTILSRTTLSTLYAFLDTHPTVGCVGCKHFNLDKTLQPSMDNFPSLLNDFLSYTELYRLKIFKTFLKKTFAWWSSHNKIREVDWVNGSCMMVRKLVIDQTRGFDKSFFLYAEELDWCFRIKKIGWKIYFTPKTSIIHIGGQSTRQILDKRLVLKYASQYKFYKKHYIYLKYITLRIIVTLSALVRMTMVLFFSLFPKVLIKHRGVITQESDNINISTILKVWWKIIVIPL